jgi:hypothetical protein
VADTGPTSKNNARIMLKEIRTLFLVDMLDNAISNKKMFVCLDSAFFGKILQKNINDTK